MRRDYVLFVALCLLGLAFIIGGVLLDPNTASF